MVAQTLIFIKWPYNLPGSTVSSAEWHTLKPFLLESTLTCLCPLHRRKMGNLQQSFQTLLEKCIHPGRDHNSWRQTVKKDLLLFGSVDGGATLGCAQNLLLVLGFEDWTKVVWVQNMLPVTPVLSLPNKRCFYWPLSVKQSFFSFYKLKQLDKSLFVAWEEQKTVPRCIEGPLCGVWSVAFNLINPWPCSVLLALGPETCSFSTNISSEAEISLLKPLRLIVLS